MSAPDAAGPPITDAHELLLRAVLGSGADAAAAFAAWRSAVDLDVIDPPSQRLLPLLARRMDEIAPEDAVRRVIHGVYRHAWARNHRLWQAVLPVLDAFGARAVPTVLLKGVALLPSYGGDWGARPMYDVDVLVPPSRAAEAVEVLTTAGWEPEQGMSASWVRWRALPGHHSWGFVRGEGKVDLHWHVLPDSVGAHADDRFWRHARPLVVEGREERVLDDADQLAHVLLHGNTALNRPRLQWIVDAAMVLRRATDPELPARFAATVRAHGELATSIAALDTVASVAGRDLVDPVTAPLQSARPDVVELLRRVGRRAEGARQLARHAAGGGGPLGGARGLLADRLDLAMASRHAAVVSYVASGRSAHVARAWRDRVGSFVHTGEEPRPLGAGDTLDFAVPVTLDRYGSVGWGRPEPTGATTKGGEPRLVVPLDASFDDADVVVVLELEARDAAAAISIRANEASVAAVTVPVGGTEVRVVVPRALVARCSPLELALRNRAEGLRRPASVRLRLRRLTVQRADAVDHAPLGDPVR